MRFGAIFGGILALALRAALASAEPQNVTEARTYFDAGSEAFEAGQFLAAVQAFEHAYRLAPRAGILFSIAQSYRRQFYVDRSAAVAQRASEYYRRYLEAQAQGGRRAEAALALAELASFNDRPSTASTTSTDTARLEDRTRILVSASHTEGARVALDDADPGPAPLIQEVTPGKHRVLLSAPGYFDEQREVLAVEGALVAVDAPLRAKPAHLRLLGPAGANVSIDGQMVAVLPLKTPLPVTAGRHFVTVTHNGKLPFSIELQLNRDESRELVVRLPASGQRAIAYTSLIAAGAGVVGTGVFVALALDQQHVAHTIESERQTSGISSARADEHDHAIDQRDQFRTDAAVVGGFSIALAVTGVLLFELDTPVVENAAPHVPSSPAAEPAPGPGFEMSWAPVIAPGLWGVSLRGRL